ncbi:MarR family winged helix-turn-helix transcriptional regulator [Pseudonocardia sp. GCM10023141]|uniref:MarR family winged helix-turn-helix transcriptional regulator n=1 Tax=Pseudonocardia sp. GCM10023141 TaxID=3252653 RepID=UPI00361C5872
MDTVREASGNPPGAAFLLAAIGAHATARFAERIAALELSPPQTGLMRVVVATPGRSQQELSELLGTPPSRLVGLVDGLAAKGLLERRRNETDRRLYALHPTAAGIAMIEKIGLVGREHDDAVCAALDDGERAVLRGLLVRIAAEQGLTPGVHPSYRRI